MDQSQIEIEGYGKIPLAKRVPVYKIYGTLEEKTFQDIVIGNMDVQYVVGNGKVQAVLLKEPANIKNIRVLLLNEGSPYYENIYLTSEQKMKITLGEEKKRSRGRQCIIGSGTIRNFRGSMQDQGSGSWKNLFNESGWKQRNLRLFRQYGTASQ